MRFVSLHRRNEGQSVNVILASADKSKPNLKSKRVVSNENKNFISPARAMYWWRRKSTAYSNLLIRPAQIRGNTGAT